MFQAASIDMEGICALMSGEQILNNPILSVITEGVQLWDAEGLLCYANAASQHHFSQPCLVLGQSYKTLLPFTADESGLPMLESEFPLSRVWSSGEPCVGGVIRVGSTEPVWLEFNAYPIHSQGQQITGVLTTSYDISRQVERHQYLERHAHYDALTGLPNRAVLGDRISQALARSLRTGELLAVCLMDLDGFKPVNDSLGHEAGDRLLQELARRLLETLRKEDTAVRLGGDEFVLLLNGLKNDKECEQVFKRILQTVAQPFLIQDTLVQVTASLGVTLYPNDNSDADLLLRHADQAMYKAKEQGKNDYFLFDPTLESRRRANQSILQRIHTALKSGQFELFYQPQVDCLAGEVVGVEALIRWNHPVMGLRVPAEFLPLVEHDDLIIELSDWVIDTALRQHEEWRQQGLDVGVSINVSARHLLHGALDKRLDQLFESHSGRAMSRLEVEILETAALEDLNAVGSLIRDYQPQGISFALDDFGTGFSSLSHLKHLAVNTLKIDMSFVRDMLTDPGDMAIVQGILGLSEAFQTRVVAEGVESIDQILVLLEMGCRIMQGFAIARPMPAARFPLWYREFRKNPLWDVAQGRYPSRKDFDALLMEVAHLHWFEQMKRYYLTGLNAGIAPPAQYDDCRVTTWIKGKGVQQYGEQTQYNALDVLHQELHQLGDRLIHSPAGEGEALFTQLTLTSQRLVAAFRQLRHVAGPQST